MWLHPCILMDSLRNMHNNQSGWQMWERSLLSWFSKIFENYIHKANEIYWASRNPNSFAIRISKDHATYMPLLDL